MNDTDDLKYIDELETTVCLLVFLLPIAGYVGYLVGVAAKVADLLGL